MRFVNINNEALILADPTSSRPALRGLRVVVVQWEPVKNQFYKDPTNRQKCTKDQTLPVLYLEPGPQPGWRWRFVTTDEVRSRFVQVSQSTETDDWVHHVLDFQLSKPARKLDGTLASDLKRKKTVKITHRPDGTRSASRWG
jgi:hypothetical protein